MKIESAPSAGLLAAMGIGSGLLACYFLTLVTGWGHGIATANIASDYVAGLVAAVLIFISILGWPIPERHKVPLMILWAFRSAVTLGLMLYYESNYGLDAFTYFIEAKELNFTTREVGFGLGTGNIGMAVWYLNHLLPVSDSYHLLKVIFSLVGFLGVYIFYLAVEAYSGQTWPKLLYFLGLFPSLVFWSSILGKDPIILFGICIYCAGILYLLRYKNPLFLVLSFTGILLASSIRPWTAMILAFPLVVVGFRNVSGLVLKIFYVAGFSVATLFAMQIFIKHFSVVGVEDLVRKTNSISRGWSIGGSRQEVPEFNSVQAMISFAPNGMFTALFRPLPGEVTNVFGLLAGLENAFLLALVALAIRRGVWRRLKDPSVQWAIALLVSWSFVYGFVSYQNLGSAFRFRLQILPVLLTLLLFLSRAQPEELAESPSES